MTYGNYPPGGPVDPGRPGPPGPGYPYGPAGPGGASPYGPDPAYPYPPQYGPSQYGPPQFGGYPPQAPLPYPPDKTNTLATLSVIFAFVFAPVGAVLGHVALGQIRRSHERGRERALIGVTLSYVMIVFSVIGLTAALVLATKPDTTTTAGSPAPGSGPGLTLPPSAGVPTPEAPFDLSGALLSLPEVRTIMNSPGLTDSPSSKPGSAPDKSGDGGGDITAEPEECLGAVAAGIDTVYEGKGGREYRRASYSDTDTVTIVDQVAVGFDDDDAARGFVADSLSQWQQCAGETFTLTSPSGTIAWRIGSPSGSADRVTVENTITTGPGVPQFRVLAVKGDVVVDVAVVSPTAAAEPAVIADRILARIPS